MLVTTLVFVLLGLVPIHSNQMDFPVDKIVFAMLEHVSLKGVLTIAMAMESAKEEHVFAVLVILVPSVNKRSLVQMIAMDMAFATKDLAFAQAILREKTALKLLVETSVIVLVTDNVVITSASVILGGQAQSVRSRWDAAIAMGMARVSSGCVNAMRLGAARTAIQNNDVKHSTTSNATERVNVTSPFASVTQDTRVKPVNSPPLVLTTALHHSE